MRRRHGFSRLRVKKQRRVIIILSFVLFLCLSVGYSAFSTDINLNVKGNIKGVKSATQLKQTLVVSGDGLYKDKYEDNRYIYKGANPNNYLKFGDHIYRIISVESDGTLKIISNSAAFVSWFDDTSRLTEDENDYCYMPSSEFHGCAFWGSRSTTRDRNGSLITEINGKILPEKEAFVNIYLNNEYYDLSLLDEKQYIVSHAFNIGSIPWINYDISIEQAVNYEKAQTWTGKVGLLNITDYAKANNGGNCDSFSDYGTSNDCMKENTDNNWLSLNNASFSISSLMLGEQVGYIRNV